VLNRKLSKPVLHVTLSLSPGENLSKDKLMEMSEHCAKDLGFENNQYIAIAHCDTNHQHLHIIANRIGFDKQTVSDSNKGLVYFQCLIYLHCSIMETFYYCRSSLKK
jgi:hypothetical protein